MPQAMAVVKSDRVDPSPHPMRKSRVLLGTVGLVWLFGIILSGRHMVRFDTTPGMAATPESLWPDDLAIQRDLDRATLVMVVQPACSCTRASIAQIDSLISQYPNRSKVFIVFEHNDLRVDPQSSSLWQAALHVPGAVVQVDPAGVICSRFHAATSGQVFVFDRAGKLAFSGGITPLRGHEGASDGCRAIGALLRGGTVEAKTAPVFGCAAN